MGQFERTCYPDGQIGAKFIGGPAEDNFLIKERINSYADLAYIYSIAEVINHNAVNALHRTPSYRLSIPCLFGQRSDRRFAEEQSFDLRFITHVINECDFGRVSIFDPHSDVCMGMIRNSVKISSFEYVKEAVDNITEKQFLNDGYMTDLALIAPDAGAFKKVFDYAGKLDLPVMAADKQRDKQGNINLVFPHNVTGFDCLIVDDLCDGGFTFITLATKLREKGARKVYLYVSHMIASKGFSPFIDLLDGIYCTNSVKDLNLRDIGRDDGYFNSVIQYKII